MPSVTKALLLALVLVLTITNAAADSYSWDEAGERYLRSSGGGGRSSSGRSSSSRSSSGYSSSRSGYSTSSSGGFSSSRYSGYTGTYNSGGAYFFFGYYAYRTTYGYHTYTDGDRCLPEDFECLEDARRREKDTKILFGILFGVALLILLFFAYFMRKSCPCYRPCRQYCCDPLSDLCKKKKKEAPKEPKKKEEKIYSWATEDRSHITNKAPIIKEELVPAATEMAPVVQEMPVPENKVYDEAPPHQPQQMQYVMGYQD
jgi:hypothetical protein